MKIVYLHQYFNSPSMAGGTRSYEMARRMVEYGHEVHMVTSVRENIVGRGWKISNEAGINVHWYPVAYSNNMGYMRRITSFFKFAWAAIKKTRALEADVIFATSTPLTIAIPAVLAAKKKNIPMVFEVRDLWPELPIAMGALKNPIARKMAYWLEHWAYDNSAAVVALSPGMRQGILRAGYPADRIAVIPNGSDNKHFATDVGAVSSFRAKRDWLSNSPLFVYAGTIGKINGVSYLVELASALNAIESDVRILVVGEGSERREMVEAARQAGVLGLNFFWEAQIPKKDISTLLSASTMAASLFIDLPEMRSNSANKFFDALAAGKPVFINYGGWMHDLIEENSCGLSTWGMSIADAARELDEKIHDHAWLTMAGKSSKKIADKLFDRDKLARQLIDVIEATSNGKPNLSASIAPGHYISTISNYDQARI